MLHKWCFHSCQVCFVVLHSTLRQPSIQRRSLVQDADGDVQMHTTCSDSAMSAHDHQQMGSSPEGLRPHPSLNLKRPQTSLGFFRGSSPASLSSRAGSAASLGSPSARDGAISEPASGAVFSPRNGVSSREQLNAALPPKNSVRPSESLMRYLRRTDSADHASEMHALHQVSLRLSLAYRLLFPLHGVPMLCMQIVLRDSWAVGQNFELQWSFAEDGVKLATCTLMLCKTWLQYLGAIVHAAQWLR